MIFTNDLAIDQKPMTVLDGHYHNCRLWRETDDGPDELGCSCGITLAAAMGRIRELESQLAAATAEGLLREVHAWIDAYLHGDKDLACSMKVLFQRIDAALKEQGGQ